MCSAIAEERLRARAERGHGAQIGLFGAGQPVEADAEEAGVELEDGGLGGVARVREVDGRGGGGVPAVLGPFLQEVWIGFGAAQDLLDRLVGVGDLPPARRGCAAPGRAGLRVEPVDLDEFEQALGIGFGATELPQQLRQGRRRAG